MAQRMPKSWDRVGATDILMKLLRMFEPAGIRVLSLALISLLSACQKEFSPAPSGSRDAELGSPKTNGRFFDTVTNSGSAPNITVNVLDGCAIQLASHKSNQIGYRGFNTTTCSNPNFGVQKVSGGVFCYQSGVWYILTSTSGPANKKHLKFRLGQWFDDTGTYTPLFKYNTDTGRWTCPGEPTSDPDIVEWQEISSLPLPC